MVLANYKHMNKNFTHTKMNLMKRVLFVVAISATMVACSSKKDEAAEQKAILAAYMV